MLQRCPVCGGEFDEHLYAHFAVTVLDEGRNGKVKQFLGAMEDHRWQEAQQFQEFDAKRDALVAYAMQCKSGRMAALIERSPVEAYETDRLIVRKVLDEETGQQFKKLVPYADWRRMF